MHKDARKLAPVMRRVECGADFVKRLVPCAGTRHLTRLKRVGCDQAFRPAPIRRAHGSAPHFRLQPSAIILKFMSLTTMPQIIII